jgi:hypothetical protein
MGWKKVDYIRLAQNKYQWRDLVDAKLWVAKRQVISSLLEGLLAF